MASKGRTERKVTDYGGLSSLRHVYTRPDTYIGSTKKLSRDVLALDVEKMKLVTKTSCLPQGVERIFLEILSNAGDNTDSSRRAKVDPGTIDMTADSKTITVKNGGLHIPVKKVTLVEENGNTRVEEFKEGDENWEWLPVFIFGHIRTSNNYDDKVKRMGAGKNGFGAKLAAIFSKRFSVVIEDPDTKQRLTATWLDNMFMENRDQKPAIEVVKDKAIKKGSVEVSWDLDFERFKMKEYSVTDLSIFARFAVDFSFTCKVKTSFNGVELDYREMTKYAGLLWSEESLKNSFIDYIWEPGADKKLTTATQKTQERLIANAKRPENIPEVEIMVIDTPDNAVKISYVNGLMTSDGGVHVDAAEEPIYKKIMEVMNKGIKKGKKNTITIKNVKPHLSFIVNARLSDPDYNSQSKTKLVSPEVDVKYSEKNTRKITEWRIIQRLYAEIDAIAFLKTKNTDGSKRKHIECPNGEDANFAGTKNSLDCTLCIVEGLSAANYPQKRICLMDGGKDRYGYLPMRGKVLNITNAGLMQYSENAVISNIKKMLGLKEGTDYNLDENVADMRYGHILMCVDADDDGMHILAHIINFFREKFPGILKRNMIAYLRTPVIKVLKKGKILKRFFTVKEFETWKKTSKDKGLTTRYYKGLGTSNDNDIADDLNTAPSVVCFYDSDADKNLNLAFHRDLSDQRKEWIEKWRDVSQVDDVVSMDISKFDKLKTGQDVSQFINRELVGYSVASLFRAIPSKYDILKESQRKGLWAALEYFKYDPLHGKTIKTGRFANKAADVSQYHHGEKSLTDTIIKMAQDFVGSNNMGYFKKEGQFGTRADGGKNAADARYSEIHLSWWIPYVFKKEYIDLVERRITDDEKCEPKWLPSVIPVGLINGTTGIATGFSTSTPCYNPFDTIRWIRERCNGNETPKPISPWFNTFTGKMKVEKKKDTSVIIEGDDDDALDNEAVPDPEDNEAESTDTVMRTTTPGRNEEEVAILHHAKGSKLRLKTYGKYEVSGIHKHGGPILRITEIPVGMWIHNYRAWFQSVVHIKGPKRPIYDWSDNSTTDKPNFIVHWNSKFCQPNHKNLHLVKTQGLSNITLIDHEGFPKKFDDIQQVIDGYYCSMLKHYKLVRDKRIYVEEQRHIDISFKIKFMSLVLKGDLTLMKVKEDVVKEKMAQNQIPYEYYEKSKSRDFSTESLEKLKNNLTECVERLEASKKVEPRNIWLADLDMLEKELKKRFKNGILVN